MDFEKNRDKDKKLSLKKSEDNDPEHKMSPELVETLFSRQTAKPAQMPRSLQPYYALKRQRKRGYTIRKRRRSRTQRKKIKPSHYKLVCISLYQDDIAKLENHVRLLKGKGFTRANKSMVIRFAIDRVILEQMPRMY